MYDTTRLVIGIKFALKTIPHKNSLIKCRQPWLDPDLTHHRVHLYMQLTLKSLQRQNYHDFDIMLRCCEESRKVMTPYIPMLEAQGSRVVFDNGEALFASLPAAYDRIALVRIDSDDMLAPDALTRAMRHLPTGKAIQFRNGIWWHIAKGTTGRDWRQSPPFMGACLWREHVNAVNSFGMGGHVQFRRKFRPQTVGPHLTCMTIHDYNVLQRGGKGQRLPPQTTLPRFGVDKRIWESKQLDIPERVSA